MNRILLTAATVAGASALAVSALATPAFAAEAVAPAEHKATEVLTSHVTVEQFITSGVKAEFTGLTPHGTYQLVFDTPNSGGPVGGELNADAAGELATKYVAPNPGKKHLAALVGEGYTLALFGGDGSTVSKTFAVKYGSELTWSPAHRVGGELAVAATAKQWSPTTQKYVAWRDATVKVQEKSGTTWKTVKTVKTGAKGVAETTIKAGKHTWRAVVSSTDTVWTSRTGTHTK